MRGRRRFLRALAQASAALLLLPLYAIGIEPVLRLRVQSWTVRPGNWTAGPLRVAVVADIHVCDPWMTLAHVRQIVDRTNALGADLIIFAGDLEAGHRFVLRRVPLWDAAAALGHLQAPLGVHAILGNHDWWHDVEAQERGGGPARVAGILSWAGLKVYENRAVKIGQGAGAFWLAGLADQLAILLPHGGYRGLDDLPATLAQVTDDAPVILLAHEPDIFPKVPDRVSLTISGHTHGGQVRAFGWSPMVPSRFGNRFAYGSVTEAGRHLIVSGGLGCSIVPVRLGMAPEITLIEIDNPPRPGTELT